MEELLRSSGVYVFSKTGEWEIRFDIRRWNEDTRFILCDICIYKDGNQIAEYHMENDRLSLQYGSYDADNDYNDSPVDENFVRFYERIYSASEEYSQKLEETLGRATATNKGEIAKDLNSIILSFTQSVLHIMTVALAGIP